MLINLRAKLENRTAKTAVIGLGYVGLPFAVELVRAGFTVIGFDVDENKISSLKAGQSYILDVGCKEIAKAVQTRKFYPTRHFDTLTKADTINICVPTPLSKTRDPDISFILAATEEIKKYLRPGQLVILESTTYPGTTEELVLPELESTGLKAGKDFCLAFSPERIDPGNKLFFTRNTPKVVGGVTRNCTEMAQTFYSQFIERVVPVSSPKCAEMVKLLENTFRSVNIGMVNEMALMCERLGVNAYEVIDAAATKPFGFMPFYPGPGLGGHCIPIDPHYLAWKLKTLNFHARFIALATEINERMPSVVSTLVTEALNRLERSVRGSKILILGVAYKKGVNDVRESPAVDVMRILNSKGARIYYNDPFVSRVALGERYLESVELSPAVIRDHDCVVILTDHSDYDLDEILQWAKVVVDTRNATKGYEKYQDKILRLGGRIDRGSTPSNGNGKVEFSTISTDPELIDLFPH